MTVRVLIADDEALVRAGFRVLLERVPEIEVVAEAGDGDEAIALTRAHRPDVVLMDVRMPGTDGLTATRRILGDDRLPGVRVIVLTTFELDEYVYSALQAGAVGFLLKDVSPDELRHAVRVVAAGGALLAPAVTRRLIAAFARPEGSGPPPAVRTLTAREREVVAMVADGLSTSEIADRLRMSPATAKTHTNRAMTKLGARDRGQLVVFAYRWGLARVPRPW
ncbi:response regulator transcription factor [Actinoplanes aureus]|uniref:Response regulator transcription factor n=1 Tax=Actinoplanes aureus TaxID=2792083 RepID=A0A931C3Z8_9ACTN|nr:response regulator transcription factor [Actinoplanes aureus]MBG0560152.1 response regulator transcription factor [Actinoplanes aureus]